MHQRLGFKNKDDFYDHLGIFMLSKITKRGYKSIQNMSANDEAENELGQNTEGVKDQVSDLFVKF